MRLGFEGGGSLLGKKQEGIEPKSGGAGNKPEKIKKKGGKRRGRYFLARREKKSAIGDAGLLNGGRPQGFRAGQCPNQSVGSGFVPSEHPSRANCQT